VPFPDRSFDLTVSNQVLSRLRISVLFVELRWAEVAYIDASQAESAISRLVTRFICVPRVASLYGRLHTRVLVLAAPR